MNNIHELESILSEPTTNNILEVFGDIIDYEASDEALPFNMKVGTLMPIPDSVKSGDINASIELPTPTDWKSLDTYEIYASAENAELPYVRYNNVD